MSIGTEDYALLAKDAYLSRDKDKTVYLQGVQYKVIDSANTQSGYQATAYQRIDTGEVVIAHRGTEFNREPVRDGGIADGGMVFAGLNSQMGDAEAFTRKVRADAKASEAIYQHPVNVTVTGHSLGGTLAEATASKFGLHGETFNAYGAADLLYGVPAGGHQVIDHVRATDMVSAASAHFGEVRVYAVQQDIDHLTKAGYRDDSGPLSLRDPIKGISLDAHAIDNFVPDSPLLGQSIISPQDQALYDAHRNMIDRYREDVLVARTGLSLEWEIPKAVVTGGEALGRAAAAKLEHTYDTVREVTTEKFHEAAGFAQATGEKIEHTADSVRRTVTEKVSEGAQATEQAAQALAHEASETLKAAGHKVGETVSNGLDAAQRVGEEASRAFHSASEAVGDKAEKVFDTLRHPGSLFDGGRTSSASPPLRLDDTSHPDHALYQQARGAVHRMDAGQQRTPDQQSDNLAAALVVAARRGGLDRVDHAVLSDDTSRTFAVRGELRSPFKHVAEVHTAEAVATSIGKSSTEWERLARQQQAPAGQGPPSQVNRDNAPVM